MAHFRRVGQAWWISAAILDVLTFISAKRLVRVPFVYERLLCEQRENSVETRTTIVGRGSVDTL